MNTFPQILPECYAGKNSSIKNFLNTLKQKQAPGFVQLTEWICEAARISPDDF